MIVKLESMHGLHEDSWADPGLRDQTMNDPVPLCYSTVQYCTVLARGTFLSEQARRVSGRSTGSELQNRS
jgi:hypothetical protein